MRHRPAPLLLTALVAAVVAPSGCDRGSAALVAVPGEVVTQCSQDLVARRPFGSAVSVDRYRARVEIPRTTRSFMVVAHDGGTTSALASLTAPDGTLHDLVLSDELARYHPAGLDTAFGFPVVVDRIMMPPAEPLHRLMQTGTWEIVADTSSDRLCLSVLATDRDGVKLALDVYVVGVQDHTPDSLRNSPSWRTVLGTATEIWRQAGVEIASVDYRSLDEFDTIRYQVLSDWVEFGNLVALSRARSGSSDDRLRLNVFVIHGFAGKLADFGLLGLSTGIPGVAGVHGSPESGVVFALGELMGGDDIEAPSIGSAPADEYLGHVMAHEIGHFLGLFHTTEFSGGGDDLADTPVCTEIAVHRGSAILQCPDVQNLMFPLALPGTAADMTTQQSLSARANPLIRP